MTESEPDIVNLLGNTMRHKIVAVRIKSGLSVAELAEKCGWSEDELRQMEQGEQDVTPAVLTKVLDAIKYFQN